MRKQNRQINDRDDLVTILNRCDVCRLGFSDHGRPYIVPMNFGFTWDNDSLTLYFHCANEGRKLEIIRENNQVCFEMDYKHELVTGENACDYSMKYESIIGNGLIEILTVPDEKVIGLDILMRHYSDRQDWTYDERVVARTTILCVKVTEFTGKRLNK